MKKCLLSFALLFSQSTFMFGALEFRQAVQTDLDNMLALIEAFDDDDIRKLAIPPYIGQELWLTQEINLNHFFVASDSEEENPIVGFCKIYIVEGQDVLGIIGNELGAIKPNNFQFEMEDPYCNLLYKITPEQAHNFGYSFIPEKSKQPLCRLELTDTYIYLGTNYTKTSRRGEGINTQLEAAAFRIIRDDVIAELAAGGAIYYIFGVVEENWNPKTHLRSFAKFCQSFMPKARKSTPCYVTFTAFRTIKPNLVVAEDSDDEDGSPHILMSPRTPQAAVDGIPGFGCFIGFRIPARYQIPRAA